MKTPTHSCPGSGSARGLFTRSDIFGRPLQCYPSRPDGNAYLSGINLVVGNGEAAGPIRAGPVATEAQIFGALPEKDWVLAQGVGVLPLSGLLGPGYISIRRRFADRALVKMDQA